MAVHINPMALELDPNIVLSEVSLGLTAYLDEPERWAGGGAAEMLRAFLARAPNIPLLYRTSLMSEWDLFRSPTEATRLADWLSAHWTQGRPRHQFFVELADNVQVVDVGFFYREIDPARASRPSVLELTLPQDHDPSALRDLARKLPEIGPLRSALGGFAARWNSSQKGNAFRAIHTWCHRFLGLDVQDHEEIAWQALASLTGINWLTIVGEPLAAAAGFDLAALAGRAWKNGAISTPVPKGLLLQAGPAPALGDLNELALPSAYVEVARALEPLLVKEPPALWGTFFEKKDTNAWMRRFIDPERWSL
jgi:hypothetical protein